MPLTADQQAMLQLVLERGQSYEDLAGVLGVGVDEVRARARAALTELAGRDPDAEVGLTDYLLGQADPIGRADAARELQANADANQLASELAARLREIAPDAKLPEIPAAKERRTAPSPKPPRKPGSPDGPSLTPGQQRWMMIAGLGAVLVIAVVLAISGAFGGGDDSSDSGAETTAETTADGQNEVLAEVALRPQGGNDATGEATFGIANGNEPYVDVRLEQVSAPQAETSYVVWLLLDDEQGYPLSPIDVGAGGEFEDRISIPQFAIPLASRARFIDISLAENRSLLSDLRDAVKDRKPVLPYQGESILRGTIPAGAGAEAGGAGGG